MNNKNKNSIGMFDITRGMLMIAVVLGHSITANTGNHSLRCTGGTAF